MPARDEDNAEQRGTPRTEGKITLLQRALVRFVTQPRASIPYATAQPSRMELCATLVMHGAAAGAVAGVCSDVMLHPFDTMRARLNTTSAGLTTDPVRAFISVAREGRLYRGVGATFAFAAPAYSA